MKLTKNDFLLDPKYIYLNHGAFGAVPKIVFAEYQRWQRLIENQPTDFFSRKYSYHLDIARQSLASFLNTQKDNIVFVANATVGINTIIKSLRLGKNAEVLSTDHEYGALDRAWKFYAEKYQHVYSKITVGLPLSDVNCFVEEFWDAVGERTKAIYLSHITSPTSLIFPIKELCKRARENGILSIIDGAHAPGQIDVDLEDIGADFYVGNLHKWLCAPKGSGFIYARKECQHLIEPLIVSWGWQSEQPGLSPFIDHHEWQGTQDISAYLSVPKAIDFLTTHEWKANRSDCHSLASFTREVVQKHTNLPGLCPDSEHFYAQMSSMPLPEAVDCLSLKTQLLEEFNIDVPIIGWKGKNLIRFSIQAYNDQHEIEILDKALGKLL